MQTELFFSVLVSCTGGKLETGPLTVFIFCNKLLLIIQMIRYGLKQEQNGIILILGVCKRIYGI